MSQPADILNRFMEFEEDVKNEILEVVYMYSASRQESKFFDFELKWL